MFSKVRARIGLDRCRFPLTAAAPISKDTLEFFLSLGLPLYEVYGMSECTGPATLSFPGSWRTGWVGKALDGAELRIADDGEILMRGDHVFLGYLKDEAATREALDDEGWLHSGDVGEAGYHRGVRTFFRRVAMVLPFALFGCGLVSGLDGLTVGDASVDAGGDGGLSDGGSDGGSNDAATASDAQLEVGPGCEAGACGAPLGFQPVFFASDRNTPCAGAIDVVVDPADPPKDACSCTCTPSPTCVPQAFAYSSGSSCGAEQSTNVTLDGGCDKGPGILPAQVAVGPFPLAAGSSCSSSVSQTGTIPSTPGRVCGVSACDACTAPPGYQLCYLAQGAVSCPNVTTTHIVATSAQIACSTCSACSVSGSCQGKVDLYADGACGQLLGSIPVTGQCVSMGSNGGTISGIWYDSSVVNAVCTPGTSTASRSLTGQVTVCCP